MRPRAGWASLLALTLVGCIYAPNDDRDEHPSSPYGPPQPNQPAPGSPPPPDVPHPQPVEEEEETPLPHDPEGLEVDVRLRGQNVGNYVEVLAQVDEVVVLVDGRPVRFDLRDEVINLALVTHAWRLGSFRLPKTAAEVEVRVRFGPTAGTMATPSADTTLPDAGTTPPNIPGTINLRAAPLSFHVPAGHLRHNAHGVVQLDLKRSLVGAGENPLLLPVFSVQY